MRKGKGSYEGKEGREEWEGNGRKKRESSFRIIPLSLSTPPLPTPSFSQHNTSHLFFSMVCRLAKPKMSRRTLSQRRTSVTVNVGERRR